MNIRLMHLKIRNFMGCKELDIEFDGADMKVYGDNGTGKTTIQHAFNWLLFDKNAYGKTDFGIKPVNRAGEVIHRLETSVEALFDLDGTPKQFKKVLMEKWTRRRGSAEETYSGNENLFYVNTIPKKKKEFTEEIAKVIDENVFRMITNPLYFNENIKWQDRRKMLLDICGNISDKDVIESKEELLPLLDLLKGRTVEELKSIVSSEMKSINKELGIIPSRIAEAELAKPTPKDDVDLSELDILMKEHTEKIKEKSDIINGAKILRMKAELDTATKDLKRRESEELDMSRIPEYKKMYRNNERLQELKTSLHLMETVTVPHFTVELKSNSAKKKALSDKWDEVFKQTFLGATCPTCKQELPPDQLEEKRKEFNRKKAEQLDLIESELAAIKKRDNEMLYEKSEATRLIEETKKEISKTMNDIEGSNELINGMKADFQRKKDFDIKKQKEFINDLKNDIIEQELNAEDLAKGVESEILEIERKIAPIKDYIAEQNMIEKQDARIEELKEQQTLLSGKYSDLERHLFLTEMFIRHKVAMINERINSYFKYTRFRLFDVQVNGGIVEMCEATYRGVPYRDLNTAGKINIGLDIINTLSTKYGTTAPIFIDNMESVTKPIDTLAQRIALVVSESDKELRFEKEK